LPRNSTYQDQELLLHISRGDEAAIKVLFELYYPRLYYFALKLTNNQTEAQDQAQEAFLALWESREKFKDAVVKDAEAFMITVVRNRAYNYIKHLKVKAEKESKILEGLALTNDFLEAQIIQEDIFNRIYQEILELPVSDIKLLKLIFIEGLDSNEIAERLNITPNNVRNQKARALKKLRTLLLRKGFSLLDIILVLFFL